MSEKYGVHINRVYRHWKGGYYHVKDVVKPRDIKNLPPSVLLVLYQSLQGDGETYARTLDNFLGKVEVLCTPATLTDRSSTLQQRFILV